MRRSMMLLSIFPALFYLTSAQEPVPLSDATFGPPIIAVLNGEKNVSFDCTVTNTTSTTFSNLVLEYIQGGTAATKTIYNSYDRILQDSENFTVLEVNPTKQWKLSVNVVKPQLATMYTCTIQPENKKTYTNLVAFNRIDCLSPDMDMDLGEGDVASASCSVNYFKYSGFSQKPLLAWYNQNNVVRDTVLIEDSPDKMTLAFNKTLTGADDEQEYICHLTFQDSLSTYEDNCTTIFKVLHAVSEISFDTPSSSENPVTLNVGDVINATANGRPYPLIIWYTEQREQLTTDGQLFVTEAMAHWTQPCKVICVANNTIDGQNYSSVESNYTFYVTEGVGQSSSSSAGTEAWIIAVAVIVPIVIIAAIAIGIYFCLQHSKKKKANQKTSNGTSAPRPTSATAYSSVPTGEMTFGSPSRPPPTMTINPTENGGSVSSYRGPPGPDNHNGGGQSPGFGDLGIQTYGVNSNPAPNSVHGSSSTLGAIGAVSMNPNPGYPARGSNQALNASTTRPSYPYNGSNPALNNNLSMNPNGSAVGRQPSIASSSVRSHTSSYNAPLPSGEMNPNDLSSMHGSEV